VRVLVDMIHPGHVHFFRHAIGVWESRGHQVCITLREKDVARVLLDAFGLPYYDLGHAGRGTVGLAIELLRRDLRLLQVARRFKPDVMVGIAGVNIAHVGKLIGVPSVVFTDTEIARLSNRLTFPFASVICTPTCYEAAVPADKHIAYPGFQELAYTHPNWFHPDSGVLDLYGVEPDDRYIVLRLVSWGAAHDFRERGFARVVDAVAALEKHGRVLISAEGDLPEVLCAHQVTGPPESVHHLLYYATLFIGESATMASESATLGTPAIFVSSTTRGYTNEQEREYDLVYTFSDPVRGQDQALAKAEMILSDPDSKAKWQAKRDRMLADKTDVTQFIVDIVEKYGLGR
jgi:predicted glycosyltransferase